jgi:hypothetical protein
VKYRYGSSHEDAMEKLRYDLYYIKHLSVIFDLTIGLRHGEGRASSAKGRHEPTPDLADAYQDAQDQHLVTIARNVGHPLRAGRRRDVIGCSRCPSTCSISAPRPTGCWMLTAGVTIHFSILDLGYGGAMVKFIAQYRAHRDARALNEIASTIFFVFAIFGVSPTCRDRPGLQHRARLQRSRRRRPRLGKWILLIIGLNVASTFLSRLRRRVRRLPALRPQQHRRVITSVRSRRGERSRC